jgi:hypothetical protein
MRNLLLIMLHFHFFSFNNNYLHTSGFNKTKLVNKTKN